MRIDGNSLTSGVMPRTQNASAAGSGEAFALEAEIPAGRPAGPAPMSSLTSIEALLVLQETEDPLFAKKKALRRGRSLLDTLDEIKADLLVGQVGEGRLNQLMALITQAREKSSPGLDALLDDIELRARVELAKFGLFP